MHSAASDLYTVCLNVPESDTNYCINGLSIIVEESNNVTLAAFEKYLDCIPA